MILFASDNNSGAHPRILEALQRVNHGRVSSYGEDHWTAEATEMLRAQFGATARPWFVFLGTAANVLGLKSMIRSHEAVICPDTAHINTDECGAPETIIGGKLVVVPSHAGKIDLEECRRKLVLRDMWNFIVLFKEFKWGRQIAAAALQRPLFGGYPIQKWL